MNSHKPLNEPKSEDKIGKMGEQRAESYLGSSFRLNLLLTLCNWRRSGWQPPKAGVEEEGLVKENSSCQQNLHNQNME